VKENLQARNEPPVRANTLWEKMRAELDELLYVTAVQEHGVVRICNLVNKGRVFERCFSDVQREASERIEQDGQPGDG